MTSPRRHTNKTPEQSLDRWLAPLRDVPEPSKNDGGIEAVQARRASHIQKLSALITQAPIEQANARRRTHWRWGSAAAAALAVAAGTTFFLLNSPLGSSQAEVAQVADQSPAVLRHLFGQVVSSRQGRSKVLSQGATLAAGDELSTTAEAFASLDVGPVRVDLTSATTVELVRMAQRDQVYKLRAGRVDVSVPHVPGESRHLEVITPDSTIKVRGTVFSVEVNTVNGINTTTVEVTRGSVGVENSGQLHVVNAGTKWLSASTPDNKVEETSPEPNDTDQAVQADVNDSPTSRPAVERSSLKDQNELFSRALQAQHKGNHRLAVQLYTSLLKRYPDSPLAPTARTELEQARQQQNAKK
jgi:hypothetical protein